MPRGPGAGLGFVQPGQALAGLEAFLGAQARIAAADLIPAAQAAGAPASRVRAIMARASAGLVASLVRMLTSDVYHSNYDDCLNACAVV